MPQIVLASGSPRRRELLERIGVTNFLVRVPEVEENFPEGLTPPEVVEFMTAVWGNPGMRPTLWKC